MNNTPTQSNSTLPIPKRSVTTVQLSPLNQRRQYETKGSAVNLTFPCDGFDDASSPPNSPQNVMESSRAASNTEGKPTRHTFSNTSQTFLNQSIENLQSLVIPKKGSDIELPRKRQLFHWSPREQTKQRSPNGKFASSNVNPNVNSSVNLNVNDENATLKQRDDISPQKQRDECNVEDIIFVPEAGV
jgi:hypothetical protein